MRASQLGRGSRPARIRSVRTQHAPPASSRRQGIEIALRPAWQTALPSARGPSSSKRRRVLLLGRPLRRRYAPLPRTLVGRQERHVLTPATAWPGAASARARCQRTSGVAGP